MATEAQRRANQKQDATRHRVALWLEPDDVAAIQRLQRFHKVESRIAMFRKLVERAEKERVRWQHQNT